MADAPALADASPPPVSVVIATRDRPRALERCLRALAANSVPPAEIVVVDNGRAGLPASSRSAVEQRTALVHLDNPGGVSRARNRGVERARHDLIAFTDDDCVPDRRWLELLLRAYAVNGGAGASGRVLPLASGDPSHVAVSSRTSKAQARYAGLSDAHSPWKAGTGGNLLLRRSVLAAVGGFDERFGPGARYRAAEDVELVYRVLRAGFAIAYEPESVVYHEMRSWRRRLATRYPYGFGMGAFIAGRARAEGDTLPLAARYFRMQLSLASAGVRTASLARMLEPFLTGAGFFAGAAEWRRAEREERDGGRS